MKNPKEFMQLALDLAARGVGKVEPNPAVGAVVVKQGKILATGFHKHFGGAHAEVAALKRAGSRARGADLYVNLEPCGPFPGKKTPPCVDLVERAGIRRLFVADVDPHPAIRGACLRRLRKGGVQVKAGLLSDRNRRLNRPYFKRIETGLPYVVSKWAMTLDGKIATRTGDSKWITSPAARRIGRGFRARLGAVLVGSETVAADDPRLEGVVRIVLDSTGRTPAGARILRTAKRFPTYVCVTTFCPESEVTRLRRSGATVVKFEVMDLTEILRRMNELGVHAVLIEGGGEIHASAFEARLVDEVAVFIAPVVIGGQEARTPVSGRGVDRIRDALELEEVQFGAVSDREVLLRGWTRWNVSG